MNLAEIANEMDKMARDSETNYSSGGQRSSDERLKDPPSLSNSKKKVSGGAVMPLHGVQPTEARLNNAIRTMLQTGSIGGVSNKKDLFGAAKKSVMDVSEPTPRNAELYPEVAPQVRRDLSRPQPSDIPLAMPQQFPNVEETSDEHRRTPMSVEKDQRGALLGKTASAMGAFLSEFNKIAAGEAMALAKKLAPAAIGVAGGAAVAHGLGEKKRKRQLSAFVDEARKLNAEENKHLARAFYSAGVRAGQGAK